VKRFVSRRYHGVLDRHGVRMAKYFTGSVIATVVSVATFAALFGGAVLESKASSLAGSAAGAIVNYFLNRNWTWERRGRADFRRELVPYWGTVVVTAVVAAAAVGAVNAVVAHFTDDRRLRTVANVVTFLGVYGLSFLVKYRLFDRLFRHHAPAAESNVS
jgi:putative flippase GtrA